jgi:hypothetical protein
MKVRRDFASDAQELLDAEIDKLSSLTYKGAGTFEASGRNVVLGGKRCQFTVFRQNEPYGLPGAILLTVQVARPLLWFFSRHTERGLVFRPDGSVREASADELLYSGG